MDCINLPLKAAGLCDSTCVTGQLPGKLSHIYQYILFTVTVKYKMLLYIDIQ